MTEHEQYDFDHAVCPKCFDNDFETTCMGIWRDENGKLWDRNRVQCACGWKGIAHELVPRKNEEPTTPTH